jgi:hypothetical protein
MTLYDPSRERDELAARHPGWRIWYVPRAVGGVIWCAQREPTLNCGSPAELDQAMTEVESERSCGEHE